MRDPDVISTMVDREKNITYHVKAYRPLAREEVVDCIRSYLSQKRRGKPKPGMTVTIITTIGA